MNSDPREFYRGRRVLITGGLGFIGSNLARTLVDPGAVNLEAGFGNAQACHRQELSHHVGDVR